MVRALDSTFEKYEHIHTPVSLMAGAKSPAYFHTGLKALADTIPQATTKIFNGFDHYSPEEKVNEIATHLKKFLHH
jgi:pimeloyl-ACP methyl ester carboxylesterase